MVSILENELHLADIDQYFSFPDCNPKVSSPKSSLLLSPGPTINSSHLCAESMEDNVFSFKENDVLSFSHSNSKEFNDFDFFAENEALEPSAIKQIDRALSEETLVQVIGFLNQAANVELQNCEMYQPFEFQCMMPIEIKPEENELKILFKDQGYRPEKAEKRLSKMRLLRSHQENFTQHFCKFKDFTEKCNENWNLLENKQEDLSWETEKFDQEEAKISQKSKKCRKNKKNNYQKKKNAKIQDDSCYFNGSYKKNKAQE